MIGMLVGQVEAIDSSSALILVGGVGYEARMTEADLTSMHIGQEVKVYTSLNVSQDAITLFAFLSVSSKRMFLQLQKVSGIGPKVALSLLSTLSPDDLAQAISQGNATALAKAPGLGKKGAQKIILELKGSIDLEQVETKRATTAKKPEDTGMLQVIEGLMSLGWTQQDAKSAVDSVVQEESLELPLDPGMIPHVLKAALTSLDRGR